MCKELDCIHDFGLYDTGLKEILIAGQNNIHFSYYCSSHNRTVISIADFIFLLNSFQDIRINQYAHGHSPSLRIAFTTALTSASEFSSAFSPSPAIPF